MKTFNFVSKAGPHLGSHRMRAEIPATILQERDVNCLAQVSEHAYPVCTANIFMKHFKASEMISEAHECKNAGSKVIFDICDNHFNRDAKDTYHTMCDLADTVTCNTESMAKVIKEKTGKEAKLVKDPITFPRYDVEINMDSDPNILWFGHASNLSSLMAVASKIPYNITCITNIDKKISEGNVKAVPWEIGLVEHIIQFFDIVIIPTSEYRHYAQMKSSNRAVDALHAGRFVVTDNPRIYGEFSDFIWIGDIAEGIQWYVDNPTQAYHKTKEGQLYVGVNYNHEVIHEQWKKVLY